MSTPSPRTRTTILKIAAPAVAVALVLSSVGVLLWSNATTTQASNGYQQHRQALDASLRAASRQGYTSQDLAPVTSQLQALDSSQLPWWLPGRPAFYQHQAGETAQLQAQLDSLQRRLLSQAQSDATRQVSDAKTQIAQAQQASAADPDVQSLQQRLDGVLKLQGAAHTLKDYRTVAQQARDVATAGGALVAQTQQENQAIQQAAQQLVAQAGGNLGAVQQAGSQALLGGRNDASIAAYLNLPSPFKTWSAIDR